MVELKFPHLARETISYSERGEREVELLLAASFFEDDLVAGHDDFVFSVVGYY